MDVQSHPGGVLVATSLVNEFGRKYPDAWKWANYVRANPMAVGQKWKHWCYMPINASSAIIDRIVNPRGEYDIHDPVYSSSISVIGAELSTYAAWRMTKGVYRFDPELYQALIDTPLEGEIPSEVFYRLPEWCVYIETPGMKFACFNSPGFFTSIDHRVKPDGTDLGGEIRLHLVIEKPADMKQPGESPYATLSSAIPLGKHSVLEGMMKLLNENMECPEMVEANGMDIVNELEASFPEILDDSKRMLAQTTSARLSLVLYLCAAEAEIKGAVRGAKPGNPNPKKTRKGVKTFPAEKPLAWDVGYRIGPALKLAREQAEKADAPTGTATSEPGYHVRPHIRRAHWHTFWTGPRDDAAARKPNVKWLPPIAVNVERTEDLVSTIHPVNPPAAA